MILSAAMQRWAASVLLMAMLILLSLVLADLGGGRPRLSTAESHSTQAVELLPLGKIATLFSPTSYVQLQPPTNLVSPFHTTFFQPAPPAKAPAQKKVDLIYQGFYQTAEGRKLAFVKIGEGVTVAGLGAKVMSDFVVANIELRTLILTNRSAQTNVLDFNVKKQVDAPVP